MEDKVIYGWLFDKEKKGLWGVEFYDDEGKSKNHWLSYNQIQHFRDRKDCKKYIKEVKSWNAIKFSQTLIKKY